ncbi:hypothetical protein HQ531_14670 [bacterium]|nr:hypothetical protein [bacterium]
MKHNNWKITICLLWMIFANQNSYGWGLHTLIAQPIFASMPEISSRDSIEITSLDQFLLAVEAELALVLSQEEEWAQTNLERYHPLPTELIFQATGNSNDIRERFIKAIRINSHAKLIAYQQLLPAGDPGNKSVLKAGDITPLTQNRGFDNVIFVRLNPGEFVDPLSVLVTANDEPDMGLDVGLYEDNHTQDGQLYGLGIQPFGNPNLEYGSQAPIHMGLYHEGWLINSLAPFIKEGLPEYRIHLYKTLSELAFRSGQDYWGWRFMGWGLHYVTDLTQPYHASALPGVSTGKMIFINALDMLGFSGMKNEVIQLISNRHTAIEALERQLLEKVYLENDQDYLHFQTLRAPQFVPDYRDSFPRDIIAKHSQQQAQMLDRVIVGSMPALLVSNSDFELGSSAEQYEILSILQDLDDAQALRNLEDQLNDLLLQVSIYARSYALAILSEGG